LCHDLIVDQMRMRFCGHHLAQRQLGRALQLCLSKCCLVETLAQHAGFLGQRRVGQRSH